MSKQDTSAVADDGKLMRYAVIAVVAAVAFFASYQFATAASGGSAASQSGYVTQGEYVPASTGAVADGDSAGGCGCGGSGEAIEGTAVLDDDGVQRIAVDASSGYDPNVIVLLPGVPTEITFGESFGCTAQVMSADLGFYEDLQSGPKTITLGPLEPGTYDFSCGMEMVFGQIMVEERI